MPVNTRNIVRILAAFLTVQAFCPPATAQWRNPKASIPPRARPQRRSGAESLPPLPLPATPLRRTERKRQPAPPALVGMINFSQKRFRLVQGRRRRVSIFPTTQIDIERLMAIANSRLGIRYRYMNISLESFSWDPAELPLLYITGWTAMPELSEAMVRRMRRYLYDGGTLVVHAQCGRKEFTDTAPAWIGHILPNRRLAPVDRDSALLVAYYPITRMRVRRGKGPFRTIKPFIEAVYLGCRPAVIYSPIDLNCGWDVVKNPIAGETIMYHQDDAAKLGVNIVTVVLANFQYARAWAVAKIYAEQDAKTRDQLI
ncbi:MAG: DUF4159 domain-containing protein, partial [Planctomycetes bacterium]|nr:DUF4159 domain-containing protein [Planctomycetota bacterium]